MGNLWGACGNPVGNLWGALQQTPHQEKKAAYGKEWRPIAGAGEAARKKLNEPNDEALCKGNGNVVAGVGEAVEPTPRPRRAPKTQICKQWRPVLAGVAETPVDGGARAIGSADAAGSAKVAARANAGGGAETVTAAKAARIAAGKGDEAEAVTAAAMAETVAARIKPAADAEVVAVKASSGTSSEERDAEAAARAEAWNAKVTAGHQSMKEATAAEKAAAILEPTALLDERETCEAVENIVFEKELAAAKQTPKTATAAAVNAGAGKDNAVGARKIQQKPSPQRRPVHVLRRWRRRPRPRRRELERRGVQQGLMPDALRRPRQDRPKPQRRLRHMSVQQAASLSSVCKGTRGSRCGGGVPRSR